MNHFLRVTVIVLVLAAAILVWRQMDNRALISVSDTPVQTVQEQAPPTSQKGVAITLTSPSPNTAVTSPLSVTGEAPGYWYFEASFPIELLDASGALIVQGVATAQDEWMTEAMVPFIATLEFAPGDYGESGTLVLRKDNPSGLPENDDSMEIPVQFAP